VFFADTRSHGAFYCRSGKMRRVALHIIPMPWVGVTMGVGANVEAAAGSKGSSRRN